MKTEKDRHDLLDALMKSCNVDKKTGKFICKRSRCRVNVDWYNCVGYTVINGELCVVAGEGNFEECSDFVDIEKEHQKWLSAGVKE